MVKKFEEYIKEDASTTASMGGGTTASGGATGSFASAAGTSVSGGDSGTAFSTNSNTNGMGAIVSAQPSNIAGDVKGGTKGSGDIGTSLGTFTKKAANSIKKGKKETDKDKKVNSKLNNLYIVHFTEFDGVKNVKENVYTPPVMTKCNECGVDVEDTLRDMLGHVYLKHWAKPNEIMKDDEARKMVQLFFDKGDIKK